jgi:hypothetical protein
MKTQRVRGCGKSFGMGKGVDGREEVGNGVWFQYSEVRNDRDIYQPLYAALSCFVGNAKPRILRGVTQKCFVT